MTGTPTLDAPSDETRRRGVMLTHPFDTEGNVAALTFGLGNDRVLYCGQIAPETHTEGGAEVEALGRDDGWWIVLYDDGREQVIAKCASPQAGLAMMDAVFAAFCSPPRLA